MYAASVLALVFAASQAAAFFTPRSPLGNMLITTGDALGIDFSDIPAECQSDCSALNSALGCDTTDVNYLCSESINQGLATCMGCAFRVAGSSLDQSLVDQGKASLAQYEDACKDETGKALASLTVSADGSVETSGSGTSAATMLSFSSVAVFGGALGSGLAILSL